MRKNTKVVKTKRGENLKTSTKNNNRWRLGNKKTKRTVTIDSLKFDKNKFRLTNNSGR